VIWNVDGGIVLNGQGQYNAIYNNTVAIDNATIPSGASLIVYSPVSPPIQSSTLISNNIFQPSAALLSARSKPPSTASDRTTRSTRRRRLATPLASWPGANNYQVQPNSPVLGPGYNDPAQSYPYPGTTITYWSSCYAGAFDAATSLGL
jgi:hypothetical protein